MVAPRLVSNLYSLLSELKELRGVTRHIDAKTVARLTRQYPYSTRATRETFLLTIGQPNYREREFIKRRKKAGEPIPVKATQYRFWPKKKVTK